MGKVKTIYLAGPIEGAKDRGENWRDRIKPDLKALGWKVIDPLEHENAPEICQELRECKKHGRWERFSEIVDEITERDRGYVYESDLLIVRWDTEVKSYGTSDEIRWALDEKIPIYCVIYGPITDESSWMLCKLRKTKIFESFTKLLEELKNERSN